MNESKYILDTGVWSGGDVIRMSRKRAWSCVSLAPCSDSLATTYNVT